jgi:4-amino-4-deoxy-L-arabinose transferase-like glycosyltransferase
MPTKAMKEKITLLAHKPWMPYIWLLLVTMLAAVLRFYKLGAWSFWIDEIYTITRAVRQFSSIELLIQHIPPSSDWMPLSFIMVAQALNLGGINEWSARLAPAIIGILTIPILYFPTKKVFGSRIALISLSLLAVSSWHLFWSQNARFYTSLMLFYSLALFAFHVAIEEDKPKYLLVFLGLVYLAASERLLAFFIFPVVFIYLAALWILKFEKPKGLNFRNLLIITLPLLIAGAMELYSWFMNAESRFLDDFSWFLLYRNDDPIRLLGNISYNIRVPLMALALFSGLFLILKRDRAGLLLATNAVIPLVVLVASNPFVFTKDRYVFMTLFSWITLAAIGVNELFTRLNGIHRWLAVGVLVLVLADAGSENVLYYQVNNGNRADWRGAFHLVQTQSQPDDTVVTYWPEIGAFYLDREFVGYDDIDVPTILNGGRQYWFVLDAETIWANPEVKAFLEDQAQLIDVRYLRTLDDFSLRIYHFDPERSGAE